MFFLQSNIQKSLSHFKKWSNFDFFLLLKCSKWKQFWKTTPKIKMIWTNTFIGYLPFDTMTLKKTWNGKAFFGLSRIYLAVMQLNAFRSCSERKLEECRKSPIFWIIWQGWQVFSRMWHFNENWSVCILLDPFPRKTTVHLQISSPFCFISGGKNS